MFQAVLPPLAYYSPNIQLWGTCPQPNKLRRVSIGMGNKYVVVLVCIHCPFQPINSQTNSLTSSRTLNSPCLPINPYALLLFPMAPTDSLCLNMIPYGSLVLLITPYISKYLHFSPYALLCLPLSNMPHMPPYDSLCHLMPPYASLTSNGSLWLCMAPYGP